MKATMLGLLAETPIHPGSGRNMGVVDLPVAREAATDYPVIPGSSMKGALRDKAERSTTAHVDIPLRFGDKDQAGDLLVSDARLLLLPIRSLTGAFRWATCPHLIERYGRDLKRLGLRDLPKAPAPKPGTVASTSEETLHLEERLFEAQPDPNMAELSRMLQPAILHADTRGRLESRLVVLHDDDFAWFARYGLPIQARNSLEDGTKKSQNLWYEESLPPDTMMYCLVMGRSTEALADLGRLFPDDDPYLQAGGNETVGHGWFAVRLQGGQG